MNHLLRKFFGVIGIALTWGMLWAAIFAALALVIGIIDPDQIDPGEGPIRVGAIMGVVGLVSGASFGVLLSVAENKKAILNISLSRAMMWGIVGSAVYPLLTSRVPELIFTCSLGAAIATAAVVIARCVEREETGRSGLRSLLGRVLAAPMRAACASDG